MNTREPDLQMISEQHFEAGMQLIEDSNWLALKELLARTDSITAEAIKISMNAQDMHDYKEAIDPAPHDSIIDEAGV